MLKCLKMVILDTACITCSLLWATCNLSREKWLLDTLLSLSASANVSWHCYTMQWYIIMRYQKRNMKAPFVRWSLTLEIEPAAKCVLIYGHIKLYWLTFLTLDYALLSKCETMQFIWIFFREAWRHLLSGQTRVQTNALCNAKCCCMYFTQT